MDHQWEELPSLRKIVEVQVAYVREMTEFLLLHWVLQGDFVGR